MISLDVIKVSYIGAFAEFQKPTWGRSNPSAGFQSLPLLRVEPTTEVLQHPHGPHLGVFLFDTKRGEKWWDFSERRVFSGKVLYFLNLPSGIEGGIRGEIPLVKAHFGVTLAEVVNNLSRTVYSWTTSGIRCEESLFRVFLDR